LASDVHAIGQSYKLPKIVLYANTFRPPEGMSNLERQFVVFGDR
jgi:hypothetical protein